MDAPTQGCLCSSIGFLPGALAGPGRVPSRAAQDEAGRHVQGSCSGWWAEGWRVGAPEAEPQHMVAVCLLGSGAGLMGRPAGRGEAALRGAVAGGGPPSAPAAPAQLGRRSLGLCGAPWGPCLPLPAPQPVVWLWPSPDRHLEMPGPGGRGWPAPHYPQRGSLQGVAITAGRRTPGQARPLPSPGQACSAPGPVALAAPSRINHSSSHPPNSWCFQGNYLMNQQCGDCGGRTARNRPLPVLGPLGTEGTRGPVEPPPPSTLQVKEGCSQTDLGTTARLSLASCMALRESLYLSQLGFSFFFFLIYLFIIIIIYLFIFGCVGSSLLHAGFL